MTDDRATAKRILVIEDEALLADDTALILTEAGARVVGPAGSVAQALGLIASEARIDGALVDLRLGEDWSWPVARALRRRGVPFVFLTAYPQAAVEPEFAGTLCFRKPFTLGQAVQAVLAGGAGAAGGLSSSGR